MALFFRSLIATAALATVLPALAAPVSTTLSFDEDGVDSGFFTTAIGSFYSGAGAEFDSASFALRNDALGPYFSNAPSPLGVLAFDGSSPSAVMNAAFGKAFVNGLSLSYAATTSVLGAVSVYSGANGTGSLLASLDLGENISATGCTDSPYCAWTASSLAFAGEARSVVFATATGEIAFDDLTITAVPEPGSLALLLASLGAIGLVARRR